MLPPGTKLRGLLDSGLWVDLAAPDTAEITLQEQTQAAYELVAPGPVIPAACAAKYVGQEWKCLYGQYRLPFVSTPYIVNAAQFDSFAMLYDLGGNIPQTPGQVAFANEFQQATLEALQAAVRGGQAVFSTSCLVHCLSSDTSDFTGFTAAGQSLQQAMASWDAGSTPVAVSSCTGYLCAAQPACPGGIPDQGQAAQAAQGVKGTVATEAAPGGAVNGGWVAALPPRASPPPRSPDPYLNM